MAEIIVPQGTADALIAMEKHRADETCHVFPAGGDSLNCKLLSVDHREEFLLDIYRGRIDLSKITYQNRGRSVVVLVRLDLGGANHRNPDGVDVPCPHLHVYREGYGDKWAVPVPASAFSDLEDYAIAMKDFFNYCNITRAPRIDKGLFE
jgi:hypothetical protein